MSFDRGSRLLEDVSSDRHGYITHIGFIKPLARVHQGNILLFGKSILNVINTFTIKMIVALASTRWQVSRYIWVHSKRHTLL